MEDRFIIIGNGISSANLSDEQIAYMRSIPRTEVIKPLELYVQDEFWHLTKKERDQVIQPIRTEPKYRRNELCPCGSKKKYKKCCVNK